MRKIFDFLGKGAVGIIWSVTSAIILAVMVRQGYIDGIGEWIVKFSDMNSESIKYSFTTASYIVSVLLISFVLSMGIVWSAKKAVRNLPSNQLKRLHGPIERSCKMHFHFIEENRSGLSYSPDSKLLRIDYSGRTENVMKQLEKVCKIKIPNEDPMDFLGYILTPVSHGDIKEVRRISERWDSSIVNEYRRMKERNRLW